ncbi:Aminopeptidase N [Ooceraea biroi]|uniref:Aminopeptidase N n=1 Tax=Ooceraea biroi TaxID=2015173 RepID=A0A026VYW6_OOCBI|nr:Aminopeptidase N [Ooceraea biroi]
MPRHYNISIVISKTLDEFRGECEIDIEVFKSTVNIRLHSPDMIEKGSIKLVMKNGEIYKPMEKIYSKKENVLDLYFEYSLFPENYTLFITYDKTIPYDKEEEDYLKILFKPQSNLQNRLLATNIQSIEARKWFPCWDEPEFKATFVIRFNHETKYKIWPTLPAERYVEDNHKQDWMWTHFVIENSISTYQVMFTLTDLDLRFRKEYSYHPTIELLKKMSFLRRANNFMKFSDSVIEKILNSDWYRKIPKIATSIDQLVIPTMPEDVIGKWSFILYKESLVTYRKETNSSVHKREVALTVAHAMLHQLLDNAISPSWWSDLWLSEGLATLLHVEILDKDCLRLDTNIMNPLSYEVQTPSQIKSLFSYPIYNKAPVILRMIQHIMGNEFQDIIKNYMNTFLKSPTPGDLWNMMQVNMDNPELGNPTMKNIIGPWITRKNYFIVRVHRNENLLLISHLQEEYYIDGYWQVLLQWIPITFTTWEQLDFNNTTPHLWLPPRNSTEYNISVPLTHKDGWIILNLQQTGYYRVKYDEKSLKFIADYLKFRKYENIHVLNRAKLIDDTYYFFKKGEVTYYRFKYLMSYLWRETDYVAWYPMFQIFRDLSHFLLFEESEPLQEDMGSILKTLLYTLSYNEKSDEDDLTKWLRQEAVRWACIFGDKECQQIANDKLREHLEDPIKHK